MTEDEAKTKWCPQGAGAPQMAQVINNDVHLMPPMKQDARCIASACMAWRWKTKQPPDVGFSGLGIPQGINAHGDCGLAGGQP